MSEVIDRRYVDFTVIKEDWNTYELDEGVTLKNRFILKKIIRCAKSDGDASYSIETTTAATAFAPNFKGKPATKSYSVAELNDSIVNEDVKVIKEHESWNEYSLEDGTKLLIKNNLTQIAKTDKFDREGEPLYMTRFTPLIKAKIPPKLREELKKMSERPPSQEQGHSTFTLRES